MIIIILIFTLYQSVIEGFLVAILTLIKKNTQDVTSADKAHAFLGLITFVMCIWQYQTVRKLVNDVAPKKRVVTD